MDNSTWAAKALVISFATAILVGSILLAPPISSSQGVWTSYVDALFTATSAVCVTGLIVVDTGTHYSHFGQAVILALIQLGGLGIMTYGVFLGLAIGKGAGLKEAQVVRDSFGIYSGTLAGLLLRIVLVTLAIEGVGALILFWHWNGNVSSTKQALWLSVFHAVSAFCNAGFSTLSANLMDYRSDVVVNFVIMSLIVVGGLGFVVLMELPRLFLKSTSAHKLSFHSRTVLQMTGLLIVTGMTLIYLLEARGVLCGLGGGDGLIAALFQSVTARTAGFNTIDIGALGPTTLMVIIFLMFIGASPGSTGGGIKTTTAAIFVADFISYLRGRTAELMGRSISQDVVEKTYLILTVCLCTVIAAVFALTITDPREDFLKLLFEAVSAFGTVGLSTGITGNLSVGGKLIITLTMFAGRVGPLTLALAVGGRTTRGTYQYPEGKIFVG